MKQSSTIFRIFVVLLCSLLKVEAQDAIFNRLTHLDLKSMNMGSAKWIDVDVDGRMDLFVAGYDNGGDMTQATFYKNNGDKTFTEIPISTIPRMFQSSQSWADFNNDGLPDLLYTGYHQTIKRTKLYKNTGDGNFVEVPNSFTPIYNGDASLVDIDGDGKTDVFLVGLDATDAFTVGMYKNTGNDEFESQDVSAFKRIKGIRGNYTKSSLLWADFDNDGLKDVVIAAATASDFYFKFYKNNGDFQFEERSIGLPRLNYVSMAAGDINQDGKMDLLYIGSTESMLGGAYNSNSIYANVNYGNLKFKKSEIILTNVFANNMELADFTNDGYPDVLYYGANRGNLRFYKNNKNNSFTAVSQNTATIELGVALLGDLDNDNDLDLFYSGELVSNSEDVSYIYENSIPIQNKKPEPPTGIRFSAENKSLIVEWDAGSDDSTHVNSLKYNIRIGSLTHPDALVSGVNNYYQLGNANHNRRFRLRNAPEGSYLASVQSIDNSHAGSDFSSPVEVRFRYPQNMLGDTIKIEYGDSAMLDVGSEYPQIVWSTGERSSVIFAKTEGLYSVNLIDKDNYLSYESVYVKVLNQPLVIIPETDWYLTTGERYSDDGFGVVTDSDRNIYIAGRMSRIFAIGTDTLWGSTYQSNQNVVVCKLDYTGKLMWMKMGVDRYWRDTSAYGILIDNDNNIVVYGSYANDFTFADTTILAPPANNSDKLFVAKLTPEGERIWVQGFGNINRPDQDSFSKKLHGAVDSENNILLTGLSPTLAIRFGEVEFPAVGNARDVLFILKLNAEGQVEWAKGAVNKEQNSPSGIVTDPSDNIYISGYHYGNATFFHTEPDSTQIAITNYALLKLTPEGELTWSISGGGAKSVTADSSGNVYAVGSWSATSRPMGLDTNKPQSILKINAFDTIVWQKNSSASSPRFLKTDRTGNLYYLSQKEYNQQFIFDNDTVWTGNRYLCKMDSLSNILYLKTVGSEGTYRDMTVDEKENVLFTGSYFRAVFSDSIYKYISFVDTVNNKVYYSYDLIGNQVDANDAYMNFFVSKICNQVINTDLIPTLILTPDINHLRIFPNPVVDKVNIDLATLEVGQVVSVVIYNLNGIPVKTCHQKNDSSALVQIDCSDIPNGMYLILIRSKEGVSALKMQVRK